MKNQQRAIRRCHRARMIKRTISKLTQTENKCNYITDRAVRLYNNMTVCSCNMCVNERNNPWLGSYDQLTIQEKKALDQFNIEMGEVDI